jgi:DNA ligase D-like protein (predicted 3'-phosphoesterase)/DNA ligase D-like protein (predicted polymerase)
VVREVPQPIDIIQAAGDENGVTESHQADKTQRPDLEAYHHKRHFDKTSEPEGGKSTSDKLIFVVQKHAASHLHYDFRLEMKGVLKSWAVPKGPSMRPEDHRLAMAVEDHPYDYKDFEGIIPPGQYGGGTVIVWDHGTYEPAVKIEGKRAQEHWLMSHYYQDALKITLHGQKLKGDFILLKNREKNDNSWILAKAKDRYALKSDITKKDKSVVSGLTIGQMTANADAAVWNSNRSDSGSNEKAKHHTVADLYQGKPELSSTSNWTKIMSEKITSEGEIELEGHTVHLTNIEKHLWKEVTKADLIRYYNSVSSLILPYLENRPLSLHIKNIAASAGGFYIKDMEGQQPAYVDIFSDRRRVPQKGKRDIIQYAVCNNRAALTYLVNLGCIDFNPWSARVHRPDEPDYISIDLDPSDTDFTKVISTALAVKEVLDKHQLKAVVKTSGKSGIHIFIPCMGFKNAAVKEFGKFIYEETHAIVPDITTNTVSIDHRGSKVYVDYTLNDYADTLACVYSARPNPVPSVSTPLEWSEVNAQLDVTKFTIQTIADRIEKKGDLFSMTLDVNVAKQNHRKLKKL